MKGHIGIFIIIGIIAVALTAFIVNKMFLSNNTDLSPSPSPQSFSEDPKYKDVKEKYNLSEEQLQILSTVNPEDNE